MAGEFLNNPFVQSIGNAMGLAPLMGGDGSDGMGGGSTNPTPPPPQVAPAKVDKFNVQGNTPREFRQHAPEAKAGRDLRPGGGGAGMNLPGVMSPDVLMHPMVQQLLGQYGISPEQLQNTVIGADPNLFMTNQGFNARHPLLSRGIEGALEGAAFTQGSHTVGEGISNVAQGLLNSRAARADKYNNSLMMPFAQAQQVAGLQNQQTEENFKKAQIQHYQDLEDHYNSMDDTKATLAKVQSDRTNDLATFHKHEANLHFQNMMSKIPLNEDEGNQYQKLIDDAGGDEMEVDPGKFNALLSGAKQRQIDDAQRNARAVAAIGGNSRVSAANVSAGNKIDTQSLQAAKVQYAADNKALLDYKKELETYGSSTDSSGNLVSGGTPEAQARETELRNSIAKSRTLIESFNKPAGKTAPGAGMTIPPKKSGKTYNPVTGKIE